MKKYVNSIVNSGVTHVTIIVDIEVFGSDPIAAATYKGIHVPDGPVISGVPEAIYDSDAVVNFEEFIGSVRELIEDYYKLEIYYKNESPDKSNYFGMLAKDKDGYVIVDFDFTLRVSNHDAHRSKESQHQKKLQKKALIERIGVDDIGHIRYGVTVNNEKFLSYIEAFAVVDEIIESAVAKMIKNEKYRKKIK